MTRIASLLVSLLALPLWLTAIVGADPAPVPPANLAAAGAPALTVYNENFAVVRQTLPLNLSAGLNHVTVNDITVHVEPDSVILRDPTGKRELAVREQNYRADPLTQDLMLSLYEGKTIPFQVGGNGPYGDAGANPPRIVMGTIVRSGYAPHSNAYSDYGWQYEQAQQSYAVSSQPLIEVDGKLQFGLPGTPLFPSLPDDSILKPTLDWTVQTDKGGPVNAELAYVTGGMNWSASYNLVTPESGGGTMDLVGWVTIDNETGKTFENAKLKLMAGDVNKVQPQQYARLAFDADRSGAGDSGQVTEKSLDEYHLYTLDSPTTLRDREIKQVEFVKATGIKYKEIYQYDGVKIDQNYSNWGYDNIRGEHAYGTESNSKVAVLRQFANSKENGLGIPLPKGKMRFYTQDSDGQLEFTGENEIDHTPKDETIKVYTGNAFDITGERTQSSYKIDMNARTVDESFTIKVRNHKASSVDVQILEHLYRAQNWEITTNTDPFTKTDAHTMFFPVSVAPNAEKTVTYTVHYTW